MNNSLRRSGARFLFLCLLRAIKRDIFSEMYYSVCVFRLCCCLALTNTAHKHAYTRTTCQRELHAAQLVIILFAHQLQLYTHTRTRATHTQSESYTCMHAWEEHPLVKCGVLIRAATQASLEVQDAILLRLLVQSLVLRKVCVCVCVRV